MLDPVYVSLASALGSAIAAGITLSRKRNHVIAHTVTVVYSWE